MAFKTANSPLSLIAYALDRSTGEGRRDGDGADQMRANSGLKAQEYSGPILGLIFLRFTAQPAVQCYGPCRIAPGQLL